MADAQEAELPNHPVVDVSWYEAASFCRWLSSVFSWALGARMPTEAEWEYLCRSGTETWYWSGGGEEDLARVGWYRANSGGRTHRVGEKPANAWGLYDVHGNVWEWVLDSLDESYAGRLNGFVVDPSAVGLEAAAQGASGEKRVSRGGSYRSVAGAARSAYRGFGDPSFVRETRGFRIVLPAVPEFSKARRE